MPLCGPIPGLTLADGTLPGKAGLRQFLTSNKVDSVPLFRELAAQIEGVFAAGIVPDHLDTHQHFALFPLATSIVLTLAEKYDIPSLRLPVPVEPTTDDPDGELGEELSLYRSLAPACVKRFRESGFATPDGLFGMPLLDRLNVQTLAAVLPHVPPGRWELMVHPGYPDGVAPFSGEARQEEVMALTSPAIAALLHRCGIIPMNFRELACEF